MVYRQPMIFNPLSENLHLTRDNELTEGDMKFLPGQITRGSVTTRLWPGGVFVYDIESTLGK